MSADQAADLALGVLLRAYEFDRYKTKSKEGEEEPPKSARSRSASADVAPARRLWAEREAIAEGVVMARDLVNEPANILYPEEFARRASALSKVGVASRFSTRRR